MSDLSAAIRKLAKELDDYNKMSVQRASQRARWIGSLKNPSKEDVEESGRAQALINEGTELQGALNILKASMAACQGTIEKVVAQSKKDDVTLAAALSKLGMRRVLDGKSGPKLEARAACELALQRAKFLEAEIQKFQEYLSKDPQVQHMLASGDFRGAMQRLQGAEGTAETLRQTLHTMEGYCA